MNEVKNIFPEFIDLKSEFPEVSFELWKETVTKELKGAAFEKKLVTKTYEDIYLQPLYTNLNFKEFPYINSLPGFAPFTRGNNSSGYLKNGWEIFQDLSISDIKEFNRKLKISLSNGQNSIYLGKRLSLKTAEDLNLLFEGIDISKYGININVNDSSDFIKLFIAWLTKNGYNSKNLYGSLTSDFYESWIKTGSLNIDYPTKFDKLSEVIKLAGENLPDFKLIEIDGSAYSSSGSSITQELAFTLATAVDYLLELKSRGHSVDNLSEKFILKLGISPQFYLEIAKFRSARFLWHKIIEKINNKENNSGIFIRAVTSPFYLTCLDPHVNILRSTTQALSAIFGSVDSIQILPFDYLINEYNDFSARLARNIHLILKEESKIDKIIDPLGGSYLIENLTVEVIKNAWDIFLKIEELGGMAAALRKGFPQEQIEKVKTQRIKDLSVRKTVIVGNNMYANVKEEINFIEHFQENKIDLKKGYDSIIPIHDYRAAEPFELLRKETLDVSKKIGKNLSVFLFTMGPVSQHKLRADFVKSFCEVGGFNVIYQKGFDNMKDAIDAFGKSDSEIAVLCSTDETYPTLVPEFVGELKKINKKVLYVLAGFPKDLVEKFKEIGIDEFIYLGADVVHLNRKFILHYADNILAGGKS